MWGLVPSRGRPANIARLVRACALTCTANTRLHFAFDDDDPALEKNIAATGGHRYTVGPRNGLAGWTNELAARHVRRRDAGALASIGDDMKPVTHGWDTALLAALPPGGGMSWPDVQRGPEHGRDPTVPEAIVISAPIVAALGGMVPRHPGGKPVMHHWYIDNVWRDLGRAADCIVHCPDVVVRHLHPNVPGGDKPDRTYHDAAECFDSDANAYRRWRLLRLREDAALVRGVREAALAPV
jgi:hypothetical protein